MARDMEKSDQTPAQGRQGVAQTANGSERTRARSVLVPPTDIYETKDAIVVLAELPGVKSDGVDITLEDRVLTIRGRTAEEDHPGYRQVYAEYGDADYERSFTLSEEIDRAGIQASHGNGVLRLVLPKVEAAKPKKIEVKAA